MVELPIAASAVHTRSDASPNSTRQGTSRKSSPAQYTTIRNKSASRYNWSLCPFAVLLVAMLTDLEYMVLGIVWKRHAATGYEVVREFAHSAASYYRSREGAIYPLLARLVKRRYLLARAERRGKRPATRYAIAPAGLRALRDWLRGPVPREDATVPPDLIRVRVYFLGAVAPVHRRAMLRDARRQVAAELEMLRERLVASHDEGNHFAVLALEGIVNTMQAREHWLGEIERSAASATGKPARRTPRQRARNRRRRSPRSGSDRPPGPATGRTKPRNARNPRRQRSRRR